MSGIMEIQLLSFARNALCLARQYVIDRPSNYTFPVYRPATF